MTDGCHAAEACTGDATNRATKSQVALHLGASEATLVGISQKRMCFMVCFALTYTPVVLVTPLAMSLEWNHVPPC